MTGVQRIPQPPRQTSGEIPSISRLFSQLQESRSTNSPEIRRSGCHGFYTSLVDEQFKRLEREKQIRTLKDAPRSADAMYIDMRVTPKKPCHTEGLFDGVPDQFDYPSLARDVSVQRNTYTHIQQDLINKITRGRQGDPEYEALFRGENFALDATEDTSELEVPKELQPVKPAEKTQIELSAHSSAPEPLKEQRPDVIDVQKVLPDAEESDAPLDELEKIEAQYEMQSSLMQRDTPYAPNDILHGRSYAYQSGAYFMPPKQRWEKGTPTEAPRELMRSQGDRLTELQKSVNARKYKEGEEKQKAEIRRTQIAIDSYRQYHKAQFLDEPRQTQKEETCEEYDAYGDVVMARHYRKEKKVKSKVMQAEPQVVEKEELKRTKVRKNSKPLDSELRLLIKHQKREIADLQNALKQIETDPSLVHHVEAQEAQPLLKQNFSSKFLISQHGQAK